MTHSPTPNALNRPVISSDFPDRHIASVLQPFVDSRTMAGAVILVATKDKVLTLETVGYCDLEAHKPMEPDNLFWIASMTKPMTATALMMLVDEGKINIDDPVEKYLPEFKGQMVIAEQDENHLLLRKPQHPILVREILSHTSGLDFTSALETPTLDRLHLRDAVRSYAMTALKFEPGTKYLYSNAGTNTAGRLIETISGTSYEEFMDQRLFKPLGMHDTTFWPSEEQLRRLAKIYRSKEDKTGLEEASISQLSYPLNNPKRKPMPAGGLFSVAGDIVKFCQMILGGGIYEGRRYLSEPAIREMTRRQTGDAIETSYGLGWDTAGGKFGHGGAYKTRMTIDPKLGLITVLLLHHANDWHREDGNTILPVFTAAAEKLVA
ncbi:MAG: beta-lactamase family protein [Methylacidiphilales bacterium]|nr:beta-lactamase family protein [Candidatus Methylacidiphilales bacterium]